VAICNSGASTALESKLSEDNGSSQGALADKVLSISEVLGGIERLSFQMSIASLPHAKRMHAIKLLGAKVAPAVREHLLAVSTAEE